MKISNISSTIDCKQYYVQNQDKHEMSIQQYFTEAALL